MENQKHNILTYNEKVPENYTGKVKDPVCGMNINPEDAAGKYKYKGSTWYFCSNKCLDKFTADPEKYSSTIKTLLGLALKTARIIENSNISSAKVINTSIGIYNTQKGF